MKNKLLGNLIIACLLTISLNTKSQNQTFTYKGFFIGNSVGGAANTSRAMMSEIIKISSTYYMYFASESNQGKDCILYATSTDGTTWTVKDTLLKGGTTSTDREYLFGGPRVIKTTDGKYRMFYRTAPSYTTGSEPDYHIRSAISSDGITWTKEGVRIEIQKYDSKSYFKHVGHSEFYWDNNGKLRALLTAKDTTMASGVPDKIYTAESSDNGTTWTNFIGKYNECHDPVVIKDSTGTFRAYFTYLNTKWKTATSADGITWQNTPSDLYLINGSDTITESSTKGKAADLGAFVLANGTIYITSNYASKTGPWTEIAYYTKDIVTEVEELNTSELVVYPNSCDEILNIKLKNTAITSAAIFDLSGKLILQNESSNNNISLSTSEIKNGVYLLKITDSNGSMFTKKILVKH